MADDWDPFAIEGGEEAKTDGYPVSAEAQEAAAQDELKRLTVDSAESIIWKLDEHFNKLKVKPWVDFESAARPDLSLYTPTCGIEDWKHTDVELVIGKGIAYIIFNRPDENNSITDSVNAAYCDAVHALHARPDIRVVVLTARGKMFCSGRDPKWDGVPTQPRSPEAMQAADAIIAKAMKTGLFENKEQAEMVPFIKSHFNFCQLPQLTVCIVNGSVMGQGLGFVCSCDIVLCLKSAFFSLTDVKVGLVPAMMCPYICLKTRSDLAKKMMIMGETFDAETAKQRGFVNFVVDDMAEADKILKEVCGRVVEISPVALTQAKRLAYGVSGYPVTEQCMWHTLKEYNKSLTTTFKEGDEMRWKNDPLVPMDPPPW